MKCALCKFWNVSAEFRAKARDEVFEQCRRHAPSMPNPETNHQKWPFTRGDDWCGDFEIHPESRASHEAFAKTAV